MPEVWLARRLRQVLRYHGRLTTPSHGRPATQRDACDEGTDAVVQQALVERNGPQLVELIDELTGHLRDQHLSPWAAKGSGATGLSEQG